MEASIHIAEAKRWLSTAVKLLTTRDLHGTKSFAIRARESYPGLDAAEELIAVAETLIAGECRINNLHDWYAVLQVSRSTQDLELIASQYRRLAMILNPQKNHMPYSDEAFRLVAEAWAVLSNPSKKVVYDSELNVHSRFELGTGSNQQAPAQAGDNRQFLQKHQPQPRQPVRRSPRNKDGRSTAAEEETLTPTPTVHNNNAADSNRSTRPGQPRQAESTRASFWTACPYCYILYEYPKVYEDCALRCQNCKRAFNATVIASPPVTGTKDTYFCCWGFFPLGFSGKARDTSGSANWTPISPMFACPLPTGGKRNPGKANRSSTKFVYADDEEDVFVEISDESDDESDDEWGSGRGKRAKNSKLKASAGTAPKRTSERLKRGTQNAEEPGNAGNGEIVEGVAANGTVTEASKKAAATASNAKKKGKAKWGRLDLNVEFSNEVEEPAPGMSEGNGADNGPGNGTGNEGDNIEGIGFFEGLDEFLNSLPILKG